MKQVLVGAVKDKKLLASDDLLRKRLKICGECPHLQLKDLACTKCGCRVAYKARLAATKCPVNKW